MRLVVLGLAVGLLVGCGGAAGGGASPPLTGERIAAAVQASGLPVSDVVVHTAESDPNKLLGRPNQYTVKVNWKDSRVGTAATAQTLTIEVFPDAASMKARQDYLEALTKAGGFVGDYYLYPSPQRLAVMRVPFKLTPTQAEEYRAWLATL